MMVPNRGKTTKEVTIILPESADIIDITYYWKADSGRAIKSNTVLTECANGERINCVKFPEEDGDGDG